MIDKIENLIDKSENLSKQLSDPNIISDMKKYAEIELLILQNKIKKAEKLSDSLINILTMIV